MSFAPASADPLKVVASFSIIADLARNVGGDLVEVTSLVGPDGDTHAYEPRPADAAALRDADVVLVNGLALEGFVDRLVEASGSEAPLVEVSKGVETIPAGEDERGHEDHAGADHADDHAHEEGHGHEEGHAHDEGHDHGAYDPHAWQSVPNAEIYVANIADAFCAADTDNCDAYRANAGAYEETLAALDREIRDGIGAIPPEKRVIITTHDAFGYFEHEYGLTFLAPEGVSTESEASAADVAALIRQVKEDAASAVFVETISNPRLMEQIAGETGLTIGGELYSDALSGPEGPAPTYVDMMRHNVETIRAAVTGG